MRKALIVSGLSIAFLIGVSTVTWQLTTVDKFNDLDTNLRKIIYEGFEKGPLQEDFEYPINSEWISIVTNHPYYSYNQPHLSWKTAWVLDGLYYAYLSTGDRVFLDELVALLDELLKRRDHFENRVSWNGNLYPIWGETSRYHDAFFDLSDSNGQIIARLIFHGVHHDQTKVALKSSREIKQFDLIIEHKDTKYEIKNLTLTTMEQRIRNEIDWTIYLSPQSGNRVIEVILYTKDDKVVPVEQPLTLVNNISIPNVCDSGLILKPMALTYQILKKEERNYHAESYRIALEEAFEALVPLTWQDCEESSSGYFKYPDNSPTAFGGDSIIPWNQQFLFVAAMTIYASEEDDDYLQSVAQKWAMYFLSKVEKTSQGYLWKYWEDPSRTITWYETTRYGSIDIECMSHIYSTGLAFSEYDMQQVANTVKSRMLKPDGAVSTLIDGTNPMKSNQVLLYRYLSMSSYVPELITLLNKHDEVGWDQASRLLYYNMINR